MSFANNNDNVPLSIIQDISHANSLSLDVFPDQVSGSQKLEWILLTFPNLEEIKIIMFPRWEEDSWIPIAENKEADQGTVFGTNTSLVSFKFMNLTTIHDFGDDPREVGFPLRFSVLFQLLPNMQVQQTIH